MTEQEFAQGYVLLAGLPFPPMTQETHWLGLKSMPGDVFLAAVLKATEQCSRFPSANELRQIADSLPKALAPLEDRTEPLPEPVVLGTLPTGLVVTATAVHRYHCEDCHDGGWYPFWCGEWQNWTPVAITLGRACDRRFTHGPHEWVDRCACVATNPVIQRRKEAQAQYAAKVEERQRRSA